MTFIRVLFLFLFFSQKAIYANAASSYFQFDRIWQHLNEEELLQTIHLRQKEILTIKNHWKEKLCTDEDEKFQRDVSTLIDKGFLIPVEQGLGSTYFLCDEKMKKQFVIKPVDEDIFCLNNRKCFASSNNHLVSRVRENIPLYRSAQTAALAYEVASLLGFENQTPKTRLMILSHKNFYNNFPENHHEKLCCVQEFIPEIIDLQEFVKNSSLETCLCIDHEEFENLFILIWCLYDNDAHAGNIYVQKKETENIHLIKMDNTLCFPTKNTHLLNTLFFLPQAKNFLSQRGKKIIKEISIQKIIDKMIFFEVEDAIDAFQKRIALLQTLIEKNDISFREVDLRLRFMEFPNIEKIPLDQLENLIVTMSENFVSKEQSLPRQKPD